MNIFLFQKFYKIVRNKIKVIGFEMKKKERKVFSLFFISHSFKNKFNIFCNQNENRDFFISFFEIKYFYYSLEEKKEVFFFFKKKLI